MINNAKVVKLQISRKKYQLVKVMNEEEGKLVDELNRDFYRFEKSEQRLRSRSVSHDRLIVEYNYELPSSENSPLEKMLIEDRNRALYQALDSLDKVSKNILLFYTIDNLTFDQISMKIQIPESTVRYKYKVAIKKMQELLKDYN